MDAVSLVLSRRFFHFFGFFIVQSWYSIADGYDLYPMDHKATILYFVEYERGYKLNGICVQEKKRFVETLYG